MASKEAENILKRLMPELQIVPNPREDAMRAAKPSNEERPSGGPSLADIRSKYSGESDSAESTAYRTVSHKASDVVEDEDDIEVVQVTPSGPATDTSGPQVRTVIISKKLGKIIGKQG